MPACCDAVSYTLKSGLRGVKPYKQKGNHVARHSCSLHQRHITSGSQGSFKSKIQPRFHKIMNSCQHHPAGRDGHTFRVKWRKPSCNTVCIDEFPTMQNFWQYCKTRSRFACAVAPRDNIKIRHFYYFTQGTLQPSPPSMPAPARSYPDCRSPQCIPHVPPARSPAAHSARCETAPTHVPQG